MDMIILKGQSFTEEIEEIAAEYKIQIFSPFDNILEGTPEESIIEIDNSTKIRNTYDISFCRKLKILL